MDKGGNSGGGGNGNGTQTVISETKLPDWVTNAGINNYNQSLNVAQSMLGPYTGPRYSGLTDGAIANIAGLQQNVGSTNPAYAYAQNAAAGLANYTPQQVSAQSIAGPSMVSPGNVSAGRITDTPTLTADQVQAGMLAGTDLSQYMNPYTQNVIASGLSALDAQRMQALNQNGDAAARAGAFGGSRHGVTEGVTNAGAAAQAGSLAANLQHQNFMNAQGQAVADINRNLQAQGMNQSANLNADNATAGYSMQGQLANQTTGLQASLANQTTSLQAQLANQRAGMESNMFNADASLRAQLANQTAGLQGAGLNLQAANSVGNLAEQGQNAFLAGTMASMGGQGAFQQDIQGQIDAQQAAYREAQQFPIQQLQVPLVALGMTPYGQSTTQTGPAPQQQQGNGVMQGIGAASSLVGMAGSIAMM